MKITLEPHSSSLIICHVTDALTASELKGLVQGIDKLLVNGKTRIIVNIHPKAFTGLSEAGGIEALKNALLREMDLAKKLGGEILFVYPKGPISLQEAIQGQPGPKTEGLQAETPELDAARAEIERLKKENTLLQNQVKDLLGKVSEPSSDKELKASVAHYMALVEESLKTRTTPPT